MNSDNESADVELLKRYRRLSDAAPSQPNQAVRSAILAEGRRAAAQNAGLAPHQFDTKAPAAHRQRWRYAAIGTACAAVLAGFLVIPRFLMQPREEGVVSTPAPAASPSAPQPVAADRIAATRAPALQAEPLPAAPAAEQAKAPSALAQISPESSRPVLTAPRVAASQSLPPAAIQGHPGGNESLLAARQSAAGANASEPMAGRLSSDLRQVTVAPEPAPSAGAAPAAPEARAPSAMLGPSTAPKESTRATSSGAQSDNGTEEIVTTGPRAAHPTAAPLIAAVNGGRAAQAAALLDSGEGSVTETDSKGRTALLCAVQRQRLDLVQLLLAYGADPNAPDAAGDTPLSIARQKNLDDIVAALEAAAKRPP